MRDAAAWWERDDLRRYEEELIFCGRAITEVVGSLRDPTFVFALPRFRANLERLKKALTAAGVSHQLYYAMKANRSLPILSYLRSTGLCGLDVCSAEEVKRAFCCGFAPSQLSHTSHGLSRDQVEILSSFPDIIVHCDGLSSIVELGNASPKRRIGLRLNPGIGCGGSAQLTYAGASDTKFGIYESEFAEALALASRYDLEVVALHCHAGCGYMNEQIEAFERVCNRMAELARQVPKLRFVNLGGGLGVPHLPEDRALDLDRWANVISRVFGNSELIIALEPGEYVAKDAGMLVVRVNYVERKHRTNFIGVNAGFNLAMEPIFYKLPCTPVLCHGRTGPIQQFSLVGNINEAGDVWCQDLLCPTPKRNDLIALLNAGAYSTSMASDHCMNGKYNEICLH